MELTSGRALRNFIYISDLMEIFVRLVESQNILERYQAINITRKKKLVSLILSKLLEALILM